MPRGPHRDLWQHAQVTFLVIFAASLTTRIFTIPKLGEKLKQDVIPLTYTPRKFISNPYATVFYVIETDHRVYAPSAVKRITAEKASFNAFAVCLADLIGG